MFENAALRLQSGICQQLIDVRTFAFDAKANSAHKRKVVWLIRLRWTYSCATAHDFHVIPLFQPAY